MDPATGRSNLGVLLHHVHGLLHRLRLEVHCTDGGRDDIGSEIFTVSIEGKAEGPPCPELLLLLGEVGSLGYLVTEEVVHVHDLGPSLLVTNLLLVLQVTDDLGLVR